MERRFPLTAEDRRDKMCQIDFKTTDDRIDDAPTLPRLKWEENILSWLHIWRWTDSDYTLRSSRRAEESAWKVRSQTPWLIHR